MAQRGRKSKFYDVNVLSREELLKDITKYGYALNTKLKQAKKYGDIAGARQYKAVTHQIRWLNEKLNVSPTDTKARKGLFSGKIQKINLSTSTLRGIAKIVEQFKSDQLTTRTHAKTMENALVQRARKYLDTVDIDYTSLSDEEIKHLYFIFMGLTSYGYSSDGLGADNVVRDIEGDLVDMDINEFVADLLDGSIEEGINKVRDLLL